MINGLCAAYYAEKVLAAQTKKERQKLLDEVPEHLKNWVKRIVVNEFEMRKRK
jgi:uncharacterized membrane-anchored protein YjiN (DUF445 family)|tara:strand:- start:34460 stop:34618 length:159 start_codon:yes stop_codon:yes gene_type:complete